MDSLRGQTYNPGMQTGQSSQTALGAAGLRAAHQVLERGRIFHDPLALRILGITADDVMRDAEAGQARQRLRLFVAIRSRLAEEALDAAVARGVRQLVVLGAGLDTFAYRNGFGGSLRIFEVDHPATQAWKRQRLADAAIPSPPNLTFVAVDFERDSLIERLVAAGFDPAQPAFFTWLGVVPYLTEPAIFATLAAIAALPGGAEVVFDYTNPTADLGDTEGRAAREALTARVARIGEALQSSFDSDSLHGRLGALGFREIDDHDPQRIAARFFPGRAPGPPRAGAHVIHARS